MGCLLSLSSAWCAIQMEIQQEGFCPHLWWTWDTDSSLGLGALLCSLRNFPSSNSAQTSSTQCISSSKHPPAPPKDHACQTNLVSQLLFQTTCHTPSRLLYLHLSGSPLGGFLHAPWCRLVHRHAIHKSTCRGRCQFAGQVQRWRENLAHHLHADNHITRRPCSQIPSGTLVQIHTAPWSCINVRGRKMWF